jgi:hypothetical protein
MSASDAEMIMLRVTKYKTSILNFKLCAKTLCIHMAYKIGIYDSLKSNQCVMKKWNSHETYGSFNPERCAMCVPGLFQG